MYRSQPQRVLLILRATRVFFFFLDFFFLLIVSVTISTFQQTNMRNHFRALTVYVIPSERQRNGGLTEFRSPLPFCPELPLMFIPRK